jgi:hypothetical protein
MLVTDSRAPGALTLETTIPHSVTPISERPSGVHLIRPLEDARWRRFVRSHPGSSVFHSTEWLSALQKTYGFEPLALTTSSPRNSLRSALLFCRVESWITGHRLVSLPFSDHCALLAADPEDLPRLLAGARAELKDERLRYVEIRPTGPLRANCDERSTHKYRWHRLDLTRPVNDIARGFHKDCILRKIRRAEREKLSYSSGTSEDLLQAFWEVYVPTRRRHRAPPQPIAWFRNLLAHFAGAATIRVAATQGIPIAAILTLQFRDSLVYKYGGSDTRYQSLGGTQFLFWRAIQEARGQGLRTLDFGRSDYANPGLILFKDRWGAHATDLVYTRFVSEVGSRGEYSSKGDYAHSRAIRNILSSLPNPLFSAAGALLYKHIA